MDTQIFTDIANAIRNACDQASEAIAKKQPVEPLFDFEVDFTVDRLRIEIENENGFTVDRSLMLRTLTLEKIKTVTRQLCVDAHNEKL